MLKKSLMVLLLSFNCLLLSAQINPQEKTQILGFNDNRDLHIQAYAGMGYTFYKMNGEDNLVEDLKNLDYSIDKPEGGISFHLGLAFVLSGPELRILTDYRSDHYSNSSSQGSLFDFGNSVEKGYEIDHSISSFSIGLDKLFFMSEEKTGYIGLGGSYTWIFDSREEKINYKYYSKESNFSNSLDLSGKAMNVHFSIGAITSHHFFAEGRLGYQFNSSYEIDNPSKQPGRSSKDFQANFNTIWFKIIFGFVI